MHRSAFLVPLASIMLQHVTNAFPRPDVPPLQSLVARESAISTGCQRDDVSQALDGAGSDAVSFCDSYLQSDQKAIPSFASEFSPAEIWSACFCLDTEPTPLAIGGTSSVMVPATTTPTSIGSRSPRPAPATTPPPSSSSAAPLAPSGVNCLDPQTGLDGACWDILNLTDYVNEWVIAQGPKWCAGGQPFATCFQRSLNVVGQDCTGIKQTTCTPPTNIYSAQDYYVLYNIYAINQFFNSWWTALNAASALAADTIGTIVRYISPPQQTNVIVQDVLVALGASLAFLDLPAALAVTAVEGVVYSCVEKALQQTPGILRFLFPATTVQPVDVEITELSSQIAGIVLQFQSQVSDTVSAIAQNATTFVAWAGTGGFSGTLPALDAETDNLYQVLNTYVISQAYNAKNIVATVGRDTNVQQLQANSTLQYDLNCASYDANGVCGAWWYDNQTNNAYALDDPKTMSHNFHDDMEYLFHNNWTTGAMLFGGAYQCKGTDQYQQPPSISLNSQGLQTGCMSTLQVCTWQMHCNPYELCEFTDCPTQPYFNAHGCQLLSGPTTQAQLPAGYLGDYLQKCTHLPRGI
ncbi:MAG: hypothetical protein M1838_006273 [Thelocarpon superellum]|nr:MAG: hypothetical protein M1838_006273 [Thelocarpon superellum]